MVLQLLLAKARRKRSRRIPARNLSLRKVLRVLKLAKVSRIGKLLQLTSSLLSLRTPRKWTLLLSERRLAIIPSLRSE